jgi:pimeloyl-ACP methyl ester carboxylesterase
VHDGHGAFPAYKDRYWDRLRTDVQDLADSPLDLAKRWLGIDIAGEVALRKRFEDLHRYYEEPAIRAALRQRLHDLLVADAHRGKRLMVIAHSMGSIVAYDTLRALGRERQDIAVDHFVTIGSPLGLPTVKHRIWQESDLVRTPTIVRRWTNLAERRDPVAFDTHLSGDYAANAAGVAVEDDLVVNDTVPGDKGIPDFHSSIGYLRTPELSRLVRGFL